MTTEENTPCNHCGAEPGEIHREWDDIARCHESGRQLISCWDREYHECSPDVWDGEWPGVKRCRELGLFTAPDSFWGVTEDLNTLFSRGVWNKETQQFDVAK
jgi:hypothetical protein